MGTSAEELRRGIEDTRVDLSRDVDAIGDRLSPKRMAERRWGRMRRWTRITRDQVFGFAGDTAGSATDQVQHVGEQASEAVHQAGEAVRNAPDVVREQARGNPMLAGALAFGAGLLVAMIVAPSDTERELLDKATEQLPHGLEPVKQELSQAASHIGDAAKDAGRDAMDTLKQDASEHASDVTDTAKDVARDVRSSAQS